MFEGTDLLRLDLEGPVSSTLRQTSQHPPATVVMQETLPRSFRVVTQNRLLRERLRVVGCFGIQTGLVSPPHAQRHPAYCAKAASPPVGDDWRRMRARGECRGRKSVERGAIVLLRRESRTIPVLKVLLQYWRHQSASMSSAGEQSASNPSSEGFSRCPRTDSLEGCP